MKGFLAVARREIVQRRLLLAAAAVCSLAPFLGVLARGTSGSQAAEERAWVAFALSLAFAVGLVAVSGASMLAPAMRSRRIAFDFSRPLSAFTIFAGNLAAAISLALLSAALLWIPAWATGSSFPWKDLFVDTRLTRLWPLFLVAGLLFLFSLLHAVGVMFRSGSPLVALDGVFALAAGLGFSAVLSRLPAFLAAGPRALVMWVFGLSSGVALLAAGLASVARGRTDIRAAHRALSRVLWGSLAAILLGLHGYASWVLAARPADLRGFWVSPAPAGSWVALEGKRAARAPTFSTTRRAAGPSARRSRTGWAPRSRETETARSGWKDAPGRPVEVLALALDDPGARPKRTRLFLEGYPSLIILSADGSRLATLARGVLSIHDLGSARTLASARVAGERTDVRGFFTDNDTFRVYRQPETVADTRQESRLEILELEARARTLRPTGAFTSAGRLYLVADRKGDRVLAFQYANREVWLLHGRTGAAVGRLAAGAPQISRWGGFLADGRIVLSERSRPGPRLLRVFLADGTEQRTVPLEASGHLILGGEAEPGTLVLAVGDGTSYTASLADLDGGSVRKLADGLYPAARLSGFGYEINAGPAAGSEATKLFVQDSRILVRLDPSTGERRVILEARKR